MEKVKDFFKKFKVPILTTSFGIVIIVLATFSPTWGDKTPAEPEFPTVSSSGSVDSGFEVPENIDETFTVYCYIGSSVSSNDCQSFPYTGNVKIKITLVGYTGESDSLDVAFAENLSNYEDAYYNFETGDWSCGSGASVSSAYKRTLTPQNPTYETTVSVEAKHKADLTHYTVHNVYATSWGYSSGNILLEVTYTKV
jgi:hypothetical protein